MKRRIPFLTLISCVVIGIVFGFIWRNYVAGILLGLGIGIILMVVLRFILHEKREKIKIPTDTNQSE